MTLLQFVASLLGCVALHVAHAFVTPPTRLPDLHVVVTCLYSCAHFVAFLLYFNWRQLTLPADRHPKHE